MWVRRCLCLCPVARRWPAGAILGLSLLDFLGKGPRRAVLERDRVHWDTASGSAGAKGSVWAWTPWGTIPPAKELTRKRHSAHSYTAFATSHEECLVHLQSIYLVLIVSSMHQKHMMMSPKYLNIMGFGSKYFWFHLMSINFGLCRNPWYKGLEIKSGIGYLMSVMRATLQQLCELFEWQQKNLGK